MRVLSTAVLLCSGIWKVYNAGNGFWEISELLQLKWLSIYSNVLQSSWKDANGKGMQLQTLLSWSFPKGFQNKL